MANWLVFSYSLPTKSTSSPRVTLWRRLRRLGAVAPTGGIYLLPGRNECLEAFQWLAQEIQQANGQALVMHVEQFEGFSDAQLIDLFQQARAEDYAELEPPLNELEQAASQAELSAPEMSRIYDSLAKLRRQHAEITQIDYFNCPAGVRTAARLTQIGHMLAAGISPEPAINPVDLNAYRDKRWVTRPQPHVDRLACAWLIRRYINPQAVIRYAWQPEADEVAFDMTNAEFGHVGPLCTFETMIRAFGLNEAGLATLAEIVHEIDLRDERYIQPEIAGLDAILKGWLSLNISDAELEARGLAVFDGLFAALSSQPR
jgi:hypothetical protein